MVWLFPVLCRSSALICPVLLHRFLPVSCGHLCPTGESALVYKVCALPAFLCQLVCSASRPVLFPSLPVSSPFSGFCASCHSCFVPLPLDIVVCLCISILYLIPAIEVLFLFLTCPLVLPCRVAWQSLEICKIKSITEVSLSVREVLKRPSERFCQLDSIITCTMLWQDLTGVLSSKWRPTLKKGVARPEFWCNNVATISDWSRVRKWTCWLVWSHHNEVSRVVLSSC